MTYQPKNYESLIGIEGLSEELLRNHFTLYEGYVKNTNGALELMQQAQEQDHVYGFGEVSRRFGWEWNGMRLHEYYFENMMKGGSELEKDSELYKKIEADFGSYENWEKNFKMKGAMRGIGWVVLFYDQQADKFINTWINEHDQGHLSGCVPILVMDAFEHAYMIQYGTKKPDYIEAFFKIICWHVVSSRFSSARSQ